jgi:hypothetical protein
VLETIVTNEGELNIDVVKGKPSGSDEVGRLYNKLTPKFPITDVGIVDVKVGA